MCIPVDVVLGKIHLKMKKQKDQNHFCFLKKMDLVYEKNDFSQTDPLCLVNNRWIQQEQICWLEKLGAGSVSGRFQLEHVDLQNCLSNYFPLKPFFSAMRFDELKRCIEKQLDASDFHALSQTFLDDSLGLIPLGKSFDTSATLIATQIAPFHHFYLVKEPLRTFLESITPLYLVEPYYLSAMHAYLKMQASFTKQLEQIESKAHFFASELEALGFDVQLNSYMINVVTSRAKKFQLELEKMGWKVSRNADTLVLLLRLDHLEPTLYKFMSDLKILSQQKAPIFC